MKSQVSGCFLSRLWCDDLSTFEKNQPQNQSKFGIQHGYTWWITGKWLLNCQRWILNESSSWNLKSKILLTQRKFHKNWTPYCSTGLVPIVMNYPFTSSSQIRLSWVYFLNSVKKWQKFIGSLICPTGDSRFIDPRENKIMVFIMGN